MDLTQLANLGEFIGGAAVLVTLIYLAVQVRHARREQEAQRLAMALQTMFAASEPLFYPGNASVVADAIADSGSLESLVSRQLSAIAMLSRADDDISKALLAEYREQFSIPAAKAWLDRAPNPRWRTLLREAFGTTPQEPGGPG